MGYRGQGDLHDAAGNARRLESAVRSLVDPPKRGKDTRSNPGRAYTGRLIPGKESRVGTRQSGEHPSAGAAVGGGGIASPLTEVAGTRTYHADLVFTSSDGFLTWQESPVNQVRMTDSGGAAVVFNYSGTF